MLGSLSLLLCCRIATVRPSAKVTAPLKAAFSPRLPLGSSNQALPSPFRTAGAMPWATALSLLISLPWPHLCKQSPFLDSPQILNLFDSIQFESAISFLLWPWTIKIIYSNLLIFDRRDNSGSESHSRQLRKWKSLNYRKADSDWRSPWWIYRKWTQLFLFSCVQCFLLLLFRYLGNAVRFHSIINYADTSVNEAMMQQGYSRCW